jgi:4-amino-4-deoxy-L-arabinose transferase-like glycosyltransferase
MMAAMRPDPRWLAALIFGLGFALRAAPLTQNRFHPDEALYATFGRLIASGRDPMLAGVVVDKPPLPFYLMAVSMAVFGGTEFAARLPSLAASALTVALLFSCARAFYGWGTALLAALALAASPMAITFANTLFTDTFLAAFLILALMLAARGRWRPAGWAFGLAFACKQSALFFLPLLAVIGTMQYFGHERRDIRIALRAALAAFLPPALLCALLVFAWDFARSAPIAFWTQGYADNNPGRLVRSNEIWPRMRAWVELLQYPVSSPGLAALALGLPLLLVSSRRSRPALFDCALVAFSLAFLAGYWLLAFNVWDRYLLILTPILALLLGRVVAAASVRLLPVLARRPQHVTLLLSASLVGLLPPALLASQSGFPIGGDHGAYDGIDEIARALHQAPPGSVLYDHWLSWELGFYLFDGPAYIAWMPGPGTLADDLRAFGRSSPRYIVAPSWESFAETRTAIEDAGYALEVVTRTYRRDGSLSFTLYRILPGQESGSRSQNKLPPVS